MPAKYRSVLLALTDTHHGFLKGVIRYAKEHQWNLAADMIYTGKIPNGWRGDGIVSFIGYRNDLADFILKSKLPAVDISLIREDLPLPKVGGDDRMIGQMAAEHFLERGYRHFAWAPFTDHQVNRERFLSFSEHLQSKGFTCLSFPPLDTVANQSNRRDWALRRKQLATELKQLPKPLAVFAYNDFVAADVIHVCRESRIPVPESVAVLGVDNDPLFSELSPVPLSSICHDLEGMAYEAAAILDRLMSGKKVSHKTIRLLPKGIMTRRSTDILSVQDLNISKALRYIGDHYADSQLNVESIVRPLKISRRTLECGFRSELNRTIHEEIVRVRLLKVKELLTHSSLSLREIASQTGFARANHLHRLFKKAFGTSPRMHRE